MFGDSGVKAAEILAAGAKDAAVIFSNKADESTQRMVEQAERAIVVAERVSDRAISAAEKSSAEAMAVAERALQVSQAFTIEFGIFLFGVVAVGSVVAFNMR